MIDFSQTTTGSQQMMREQIKNRGVSNPSVLEAIEKVDRALFVPKESRSLAYADRPLPIGEGQTISQPYVVAVMMEALELEKSHKVLEIGAGSLYNAALMAKLVRQVFTIEIKTKIYEKAQALRDRLDLKNVHIKQGDGHKGWQEEAPFDRIILTAAPPLEIPHPLTKQLREGGKMIAPLGEDYQDLILFQKKDGILKKEKDLFAVRFVPMVNEEAQDV